MACIADRRLYLTQDNRVVEEGDPAAAFLFCAPGQPILESHVAAYCLSVVDGRVVLGAKSAAVTEDKALHPTEDKAKRRRGRNKKQRMPEE